MKKYCLFFLVAFSGYLTAFGQTTPNIDFESGSLTYGGWKYYTGSGGFSAPTLTAPMTGRHTLKFGTARDHYGGFPVVAPFGGSYSLKLGDSVNGIGPSRCKYLIDIPPGVADCEVTYHYATVIEAPTAHSPSQQPRMIIKAYDSSTLAVVSCDSFTYSAADTTSAGFIHSSVLPGDIWYKPWTSGHMKFRGLGGHTVAIDFLVGGCTLGGHFGYGYIDITPGVFLTTKILPCSTATDTLLGPDGYASYHWYDSATFSTSYGTTRNCTLSAPASRTTYALVLTPYSGYGCPDTFYTVVIPTITFSGTPYPGTSYAIRSANCSDPDTLLLSGYSYVCGLTFQWQQSSNNITWTNISGFSLPVHPYSVIPGHYYRCAVSCIASGITTYSSTTFVPATLVPGLHTVINPPDTVCSGAHFYVSTCGASTAFNVSTWYGDGTSDNQPFTTTGLRHADIVHPYAFPGTYSVKQVLYDGSSALDSATFSCNYLYCSTLPVSFYIDQNYNCMYDSGDVCFNIPVQVQVDSNGIPIDTVSATSGFYYKTHGGPGTVYAFRIVNDSTLSVCSGTSVIYDTIIPLVNSYPVKYFPLSFDTSFGAFDLREYTLNNVTGTAGQHANIYFNNATSVPQSGVVTLHFTPKCVFRSSSYATPPPSLISGNTLSWNVTGVTNTVRSIYYTINSDSPPMAVADTIHSDISITPIIGDCHPANNAELKIDTVRAGCDPNFIEVNPIGCIPSGTQLKYSISFENTGNDTAHNIYILDTLSADVNLRSVRIIFATAQMNVMRIAEGGYNILKFDFPSINLLDSSHHGLCDGGVIFTVDAKAGLPDSTRIANRAGIYFDINGVVMTNTVSNLIGCPSAGADELVKICKNKVGIFPNPATTELTITMAENSYNSLTISNTYGQMMWEQRVTASQTKIDIKSLPPGIYIVALRGDAGIEVKKFIRL